MTLDSNEAFARLARPNPNEANYEFDPAADIEGEVPRELNGTLYRNGPSQRVLPKSGERSLHLFDGDALINAIRFDDGRAHHLGRYAQTESFLREQDEGVYCFDGLNVPSERRLEDIPFPNQPNTNVVPHSGRLFALVENAPPFELDPNTLDAKGPWRLDGKMLGMATTAHPKIDGKTGQMWIHGYQPIEPYVQLYCIEPDGSVSLAEAIDTPWAAMMHDFAITENYVIFPLGSLCFDIEAIGEGVRFSEFVKYDAEKNFRFGIRRREPGSEVRWFETASTGFAFHSGNAYEEEGRIFMDACTYEDPQGLMDSLDVIRSGRTTPGIIANPYLYEFDLEAGTCKETKFSSASAEFPRIDDRLVGHRNRFGYAVTAEEVSVCEGPEAVFRRLTKYDREGGASVHRPQVEGQWTGEPVFVPRTPDAEEDDGFLLTPLFDAPSDRSAIDIIDARAIDSEPLARLWMRERMPLGFHGNWLGAGN